MTCARVKHLCENGRTAADICAKDRARGGHDCSVIDWDRNNPPQKSTSSIP
jgi:hypothetical protein